LGLRGRRYGVSEGQSRRVVGRRSGVGGEVSRSPHFSALLIGLRLLGFVGALWARRTLVPVPRLAPLLLWRCARGDPLSYTTGAPDQGADQIGFPIRRSEDHIPNTRHLTLSSFRKQSFFRRERPLILCLIQLEDHFFTKSELQPYAPDKFLTPFLQGFGRVAELKIQGSDGVGVLQCREPPFLHRLQVTGKPRPDGSIFFRNMQCTCRVKKEEILL
jgi:hypothetical protein